MSTLTLTVTRIDDSVAGVRTIEFADPNGAELPSFVPGSHLVLDCGGRHNSYSLTSDGTSPMTYSISVLRVDDGSGGSRWVHDALGVGMQVSALTPRSAFAPVARAAKHLLIAGGIGVTPMVSHLRAAHRWGREAQVLYVHRPGHGAHLDDVANLTGGAAECFTDREAFTSRLHTALRDQPIGTHLYVCGPAPMIDAVLDAAVACGWPQSRLHSERFGADDLDPGEPFELILGGDTRLTVPSGTSVLEALEQVGVTIPNLCRQGVCGQCRIPVSGGTPLHRDLFLTDDEKAAGDSLMACVSRADGPCLEVAL